jgi:4-hydroxybenzoate polyprenyltransferase
MEWKEHVAWIVPIAITAAAVIVIWYARDLKNHPQLRSALLGFVATSLFAAGIAGFFGAMLNKNAPVDGGQTIHLVQGE